MYTEPGNSILRHKVLSSWKHKVLGRVEAYSKQQLDTIQKHTAGPFDSKQNDVIMMFCVYALHVTVYASSHGLKENYFQFTYYIYIIHFHHHSRYFESKNTVKK